MRLASTAGQSAACASIAILLAIACGGDFHSTGTTADGGAGGRATHGPDAGTGGSSATDGGDQSGGGTGAGGRGDGGAAAGGAIGSGGGPAGGAIGSGGSSDGGRTGSGGVRPSGGAGGRASGGRGGMNNTGGAATGGTSMGGGGGVAGHAQHAQDYDQTCNVDTDCVLVVESSDVCTSCACDNAAIAKSADQKWNDDRTAFDCPPIACPAVACPAMIASCAKGMCVARKPLVIASANYDQSCAMDADCRTLPLGEVCEPCHCKVGPVSNDGYAQYMKDKSNVDCTPATCIAKCVAPPAPHCEVTGVLIGVKSACTLGTGGTAVAN
ncbi:MAG TPA: hypothetical protein VHU80_03220 [Polyangiaceae bacterium]|jgi:hypothetical protein|nr:hypothetical protein [Polyangiaceae bacterium]